MTAAAHAFPQVLTHNYYRESGPFKNICELPLEAAQSILDEIGAATGHCLKPDYLRRRLEAEAWLVGEARAKLGSIPLERPVYAFLGDFTDGLDPRRPESFLLRLSLFEPKDLTFTASDSMSCYEMAPLRRVFTLEELAEMQNGHGVFKSGSESAERRGSQGFIEVQIWNAAPLKDYLNSAS